MKKVITWLLMLIMIVSLAGCQQSNTNEETQDDIVKEEESKFQVGYGMADITPYTSVNLGGWGDSGTRMSQGYVDPLSALSVVMTDEDNNTLILIVTDLSWGSYVEAETVRQAILLKYDIPGEYVMLGGTHNHSAPAYSYKSEEVKAYMAYWLEAVMNSVEMAMDDRKPSKMLVGRTETQDLNFVRRYWLQNGQLLTDSDSSSVPIVSHETEADEEVQLVKFTREEKEDILIVNWQAHASTIGHTLNATGEWPAVMREKINTELGCHTIFFQGACGNLNPRSRIEGEGPESTSPQSVGESVANVVIQACQEEGLFQEVQTGKIQVKQDIYMATTRPEHENKKKDLELNTIAFGDVSVVTFPLEMFDTTGMQIKSQTPFDMTLLMGFTCGYTDYCPDKEAYANGGYEVTKCFYVSGTAEEIVSIYLNNLNEFKASE